MPTLIVEHHDLPPRLDVWLARHLPDISRARAQVLLREGHITVDGQHARASQRPVPGQTIEIRIPPPTPAIPAPEDIPLAILYEDPDIIVINKPPGLVVHPAAGHADGTLVNALLHHCADLAGIGGERRPGIVHRLDKDTSGVMVVAKNEPAMHGIVEQFKCGGIAKEYAAILHGVPSPRAGTIETLIGRDPGDRKRMSASPARGRPAVTHYCVREAYDKACLTDIRIDTGRTHQIRVHMAHIGHPVLGDRQYGGRRERHAPPTLAAPRQMLHAARLALRHPRTNEPRTFEAPLATDIIAVLESLRQR